MAAVLQDQPSGQEASEAQNNEIAFRFFHLATERLERCGAGYKVIAELMTEAIKEDSA